MQISEPHIDEQASQSPEGEGDDEVDVPLESQISRVLSERTTKVVVILTLCMLFGLRFFQVSTYFDPATPHEQGALNVVDFYEQLLSGKIDQ